MNQTFPLSRRSQPGYSIDEVEDFLEAARKAYTDGAIRRDGASMSSETIRQAAFSLEKRGYSTSHVDAALVRLEDAFSARERVTVLREHGNDEWQAITRKKVREIVARLERGKGKRFRRVGLFTRGYNRDEVDSFSELLVDCFRSTTRLSVEDVRGIAFRSKFRGYNESQVDLLLDAVVDVMLAVR